MYRTIIAILFILMNTFPLIGREKQVVVITGASRGVGLASARLLAETDKEIQEQMETHTVILLLEAKPGTEEQLKEALIWLAEKSRAEENCLEYRLHQDTEHPTKFALYEKWKSKELHHEQFTKPYIQEFAARAEPLLARPYQGLFGREVQNQSFSL